MPQARRQLIYSNSKSIQFSDTSYKLLNTPSPHAHTISHAFILHIPYLWWKPVLLEPRSSRGYKGWEEDGGTPCCLCCRSHRDSIGFVLDKHFQAFISVSTKERLWSTKTLDAQSPFPSHFCVLVFFYLTIFFYRRSTFLPFLRESDTPSDIVFDLACVIFLEPAEPVKL